MERLVGASLYHRIVRSFIRRFYTFLGAILDDWLSRLVGPLSLFFTIWGLLADGAHTKAAAIGLGFLCWLVAAYRVWAKQHIELVKYRDDRPRLLVPPHGLYQDVRTFTFTTTTPAPRRAISTAVAEPPVINQSHRQFPMLHLRIKSDTWTPLPTERSLARRVSATVTASDVNGKELFEMHGRWSDEPQPTHLAADRSVTEILAVDFGLGQSRELDLCLLERGECFGFNNDSYQRGVVDRQWAMPGSIHCLKVRVQGVLIDETWIIDFESVENQFRNLRCASIQRPAFDAFLPQRVE
jgi:hypothetical protein